jgi:hypothetical protein
MSEAVPPAWVRTNEGRLEPFDADRIARSLFAAAQRLGQADAFLCRELTDGVVHFLALETEGTPSVAELAEVVGRTVRELGHPALARAYEERPPQHEARTTEYAADIMAAHKDGLIELADRQAGDRLAARVAPADRLLSQAPWALRLATEWLGPQTGRIVVPGGTFPVALHFNAAPREAEAAPGSLFPAAPLPDATERSCLALEYLRQWPAEAEWHLGEADQAQDGRLETVCALALEPGRQVAFVFDRPRRPVALGEGLTRLHPAVLTRVGLNLLALAEQPGMWADPDRYLQRLGSLARLALSAAVQRRSHLRARGLRALSESFLLDRARFVAYALHLDEVVRGFTGWGLANGGPSLALGVQIARRLVEVLRDQGRHLQLDTHLEGLTPLAPQASLRAQFQAAGALHAVAEGGTLWLHLPAQAIHTPDSLAAELRRAWRETAVGRVLLVKPDEAKHDRAKGSLLRPAVPPIPPDGC